MLTEHKLFVLRVAWNQLDAPVRFRYIYKWNPIAFRGTIVSMDHAQYTLLLLLVARWMGPHQIVSPSSLSSASAIVTDWS